VSRIFRHFSENKKRDFRISANSGLQKSSDYSPVDGEKLKTLTNEEVGSTGQNQSNEFGNVGRYQDNILKLSSKLSLGLKQTNAWKRHPTPFEWDGKRAAGRHRARMRRHHQLGGSGACTAAPIPECRASKQWL
jgi:hypothetical protein